MTRIMKFAAVAALVAPFLMGGTALAATISNPLFSNGQTTIDATGGATVSGTFTLTVGSGEVVEWLRTQSDASQPFVDTSVGGNLGYQEQVYTNVPFSVKVPPNTGTYYPTVQGAGIFGGNRAINGGDNVVLGSTGLGTVRVVANGTDSTPSSVPAWQSAIDALTAKIAQLTALFSQQSGGTSAPSAVCGELGQYSALYMGSTGQQVVQLQGLLLSKGASIPALAAGASFGYFGPQTNAALVSVKASNHCN